VIAVIIVSLIICTLSASYSPELRLALASRMCKLYVGSRRGRAVRASGDRRRVAPHMPLEGAKMAELHYMEMGWSGSGWMDPLPSEPPPSPSPASSPSSFDFDEPSPARRSEGTGTSRAAPRRKSTGGAPKRASKKSARKGAKKSARAAARKRTKSAKRGAKKSARKSARSSSRSGGRRSSARKSAGRSSSRKRAKKGSSGRRRRR
jgi:hypothetical protein